MELVLSLFPGIDGFGKGFERAGYCVVRGPDVITGGDIREFKAMRGRFDGIIAGPPCQGFSGLNRTKGGRDYGLSMLAECARVIGEARPDWFLIENVIGVPDFIADGYEVQRFNLDYAWLSPYGRLRVFQFGSRKGVKLSPMLGTRGEVEHAAIVGASELPFEQMRDVQGFDSNMRLSGMTRAGKRAAVANAVPIPLAQYCAELVREATGRGPAAQAMDAMRRRCKCSCGRPVAGRQQYASAACRVRACRARAS